MRRRLVVLVVLVAALGAVGCRVDASLEVEVAEDGSGLVELVVEFDAPAVALVPDLPGALRTDDLIAAGWQVAEPVTAEDGAVTWRAGKPFGSVDELAAVLAEVAGGDGVVRDVRLERDRSFARVRWRFAATLDGGVDPATFGDAQLAAVLGEALGRDVASLEAVAGRPLAEAASFTLEVALPAGGDPVRERWTVVPGEALRPVVLEASVRSWAAVAWAVVAGSSVALLVVAGLVWAIRGRLRPGAGTPAAGGAGAGPDAVAPGIRGARTPRRLELVVLSLHGAVLDDPDPVARLAELVAGRGGTSDRDRVAAVYAEAVLGRLSSPEVWGLLQVPGEPDELDEALAAAAALVPDLSEFVALSARRGIGVACVGDDTVAWSGRRRRHHPLAEQITPWVVSAEAGARMPAAVLFEQVAERAGVPLANCLFLDHRDGHLDAARRLGLAVVAFGPHAVGGAHRQVAGFNGLLRRQPE